MAKWQRLTTFATYLPHWLALSGPDSVLVKSGWGRSRQLGRSIDKFNEPIPWITYSSLAFLEPRIRKEMSVFEYGAGASTLWWARRVERVVACEHDAKWYEQVRRSAPSNVQVVHAALDGERYARELLNYEHAFDVIVIDGRERVSCAKNSLHALKVGGVILWDNSEREEYRAGYEFLEANGFRRIDFTGMGPINVYSWSTSIFYRDDNCLGI